MTQVRISEGWLPEGNRRVGRVVLRVSGGRRRGGACSLCARQTRQGRCSAGSVRAHGEYTHKVRQEERADCVVSIQRWSGTLLC